MRLLVLDHLRRFRLHYVGVIAVMAVMWLSVLQGGMEPRWAFAGSLLLASFAGPFAVLFQLTIREYVLLPVSRQDQWRARWMVATVIAAAVTATGKSLAIAIAPFFWPWMPLRLDLLVMSTIVDIALLGMPVALMAWLARRRSGDSGPLETKLEILAMLTILLAPFLGFALGEYLPVDVNGLKRVWWVLAPGIASFVAIQIHSPANVRPATVIGLRSVQRRSTTLSSRSRTRRTPASASLATLLIVKAAVPAVMTMVLVLFGVLVDSASHELNDWMMVALIVGGGDWRDRLRQLRLLPRSTSWLMGLILSTPALSWLIMTTTIAQLHAVFPSHVVSPPAIPWLPALIGFGAISEAVTLRFGWGGRLITIIPGTIAFRLLARSFGPASSMTTTAMTASGCGAMLVAILICVYALKRSSAPYRAPKYGLTFGPEASQTR